MPTRVAYAREVPPAGKESTEAVAVSPVSMDQYVSYSLRDDVGVSIGLPRPPLVREDRLGDEGWKFP